MLSAQCRTVKISILGDEGVPVQVDGEAWIQPPGYIRIIHKNRAQMLTRDRAFESTLKSWEDKQKCELPRPPSFSLHPEILSEEEATQLDQFGQAAGALIHRSAPPAGAPGLQSVTGMQGRVLLTALVLAALLSEAFCWPLALVDFHEPSLRGCSELTRVVCSEPAHRSAHLPRTTRSSRLLFPLQARE